MTGCRNEHAFSSLTLLEQHLRYHASFLSETALLLLEMTSLAPSLPTRPKPKLPPTLLVHSKSKLSPTFLARPRLISSLLYLMITTSLPSLVGSVTRVSVALHSFKNPENRLLDGTYCNTQDNSTPCLIKLLVSFTAPFTES